VAAAAQTITLAPIANAFGDLPAGPEFSKSSLPRACIEFSTAASTISAKSALDTNRLTIACTLPVNYGYVLSYLTMTIFFASQGDIDNYQDVGNIDNNPQPAGSVSAVLSAGSFTNPGTNFGKCFRAENPFKLPMFRRDGGAITFNTFLVDDDGVNATGAGTLLFYACFLQYDIAQMLNVALNAPLPVRTI